ncbi:MAG: hypothetical protein FWE21_03500 [Defluviitaleaceae bacterium]|nr:hypothetical protein [Defluviitaleaceae bacterium]
MKKQKRKNIVPFVIILLAGVGLVGGIFWWGLRVQEEMEQPFVHERRHTAGQLYNETLGRDMVNDYPATPRALMELYAATVVFLTGDFIACEDMFLRAINFQRSLFTDELAATTTAQGQLNTLRQNVAIMQDYGLAVRRPVVYEFTIDYYEGRTALVEVRRPFRSPFDDLDDMYRVYYLALDWQDRWKIHSWAQTDENFQLLGAN